MKKKPTTTPTSVNALKWIATVQWALNNFTTIYVLVQCAVCVHINFSSRMCVRMRETKRAQKVCVWEWVTIWMFVYCFQADLISRISQRMSEWVLSLFSQCIPKPMSCTYVTTALYVRVYVSVCECECDSLWDACCRAMFGLKTNAYDK